MYNSLTNKAFFLFIMHRSLILGAEIIPSDLVINQSGQTKKTIIILTTYE